MLRHETRESVPDKNIPQQYSTVEDLLTPFLLRAVPRSRNMQSTVRIEPLKPIIDNLLLNVEAMAELSDRGPATLILPASLHDVAELEAAFATNPITRERLHRLTFLHLGAYMLHASANRAEVRETMGWMFAAAVGFGVEFDRDCALLYADGSMAHWYDAAASYADLIVPNEMRDMFIFTGPRLDEIDT